MSILNYRDLKIWQLGKQLAVEIYRCTGTFPSAETFGMSSQMRRAAVSIPSNIRYLYFALASCAELETQSELAFELGYVGESWKTDCVEMTNHESRMIRKLIAQMQPTRREARGTRHAE
ncbi:MAG: four helix bundle protein [Gammaproteobacteria bacterium]|nr:four helix bundle protein [Gammaproteobacteria bacterium]